jgi:hypothetical protein
MIERDITTHPDHFVLNVDESLLVHFSLGSKNPNVAPLKAPISGEMGTGNLITKHYAVIFYQGDEALSGLIEFAEKSVSPGFNN